MLRHVFLLVLLSTLISSAAYCAPGDWLGAPPPSTTPVETSKPLLGTPIDDGGARIYRVDLNARQIAPSSAFSADGKYLFLLQKKVGVLQIEMPSFRLVRTLALPCDGGSVAMSREGLVVGSDEATTLWVLNPQSLKLIRAFKLEEARQVTASPKSPLVFVGGGSKIYSIDLRKDAGDAVAYQPQSFQIDRRRGEEHQSVPLGNFGSIFLSPENDALYSGFNGTITRFSIQGRTLVADANSDLLGLGFEPNAPAVTVSPDGRYVALPGNSGNFRDDFRNFNSNQTWIFKTTDLREPVLRLDGPNNARSVGFDPAAGRIYLVGVPGFRASLYVYDSKGELLKTLSCPGKDNDFGGDTWDGFGGGNGSWWKGGGWTNGRPLAVSPSGNKVLMGWETGLFWFDLPTTFTATPRTPEKAPKDTWRGGGFGGGGGGFNF